MEFKNTLPEWKNEGMEPSDELKTKGFQDGYKPPAGIFNWFWSLVTKAIKEIQEKVLKTAPNMVVHAIRELTEDGKEIYVVTDSDITELYNGLEITIIPNERNTTSLPRLKINDFGDNGIRLALSFNCAATTAFEANYFQVGRPITLKYHSELSLGIQGDGAWLLADRLKTSAQDLYGNVPIDSGGTGADTAEEALENLGVADYVVERGTSGIWTYEKWASGKSECWGTWIGALTDYENYNGFHFYQQQVAFPEGLFAGNPVPTYTVAMDDVFCVSGMALNLFKDSMGCYAMSFGGGERLVTFNIIAKGKWK